MPFSFHCEDTRVCRCWRDKALSNAQRESGEWTDRVGDIRPCVWTSLKNTHTHAHTNSISIDHFLKPQSPHPHAQAHFVFLHYLLQEEAKKRMKTSCSTRVATQDEFCSTSLALTAKGSVFTTLLQV